MNSPVKFWPITAQKLDEECDQRVIMVSKVKSNRLSRSVWNQNFTAVTTNTRLWRVFSVCLNLSLSFRGRQSTVSMVFHALTEKVPSSLNEGRISSNNDGFLNYFIKMKDYIVKTTRSLRAEWNSRNIVYSLRNAFQVVYLFDRMKTREPWTTELPRS